MTNLEPAATVRECSRTTAALLTTTELDHLSIAASSHGLVVVRMKFRTSADYDEIELQAGPSLTPQDIAIAMFDRLQTYLAENGATRADARPKCKPGHAHPALCRYEGQVPVLFCQQDMAVVAYL